MTSKRMFLFLPSNSSLLPPALHSSNSFLMWVISTCLQKTLFSAGISLLLNCHVERSESCHCQRKKAGGRSPPSAAASCSISLASSDWWVQVTEAITDVFYLVLLQPKKRSITSKSVLSQALIALMTPARLLILPKVLWIFITQFAKVTDILTAISELEKKAKSQSNPRYTYIEPSPHCILQSFPNIIILFSSKQKRWL